MINETPRTLPCQDLLMKPKMISASCNTLLRGADYSEDYSCLAFASDNLIHIYDLVGVKTHLTLKGHKQRVNGVKWIQNRKLKNDLIELLSCSADGSIIHWTNLGKENNPFDYSSWSIEKVYKMEEKDSSVNMIDSLFLSSFEKYFVAFSSTSHTSLFYFDVDLKEYKLFDKIKFKKLQDAMALTCLNDSYLLLLSGGYDSLINIHLVMRVKAMNKLLLEGKSSAPSPVTFKLSLSGHLNDIRDISAFSPYTDPTEEFYFATCSQDSYIRIWHLNKLEKKAVEGSQDVFEEYKSKTSYVLTADEDFYNITLDSVLSGHEEAISSVRWGKRKGQTVILSSSFDFTVGLWSFDQRQNLWNREVTLGEMVGNKHAFFLALFADQGESIIAYTYNGALYYWKNTGRDYVSMPIVKGHFGAVTDLDWDKSEAHSYLVTTSEDQTTRLFAIWKANETWHEVNRPQIHGYDINTLALLSDGVKNQINTCKIVSGADEKIIRVFDPPYNLVKFLKSLSDVDMRFNKDKDNSYYEKYYESIEGSKQALGLMTKKLRIEAEDEEENADFSNFEPEGVLTNSQKGSNVRTDYSTPPDEDFLTNYTLWPEANKLYGHGYEIICLAVSHSGKFIASGGKAQSDKHSKLFLWDAQKNNLICKLDGHELTIVQIEFSADDEYILSVSRDRSLCLFRKCEEQTQPYKLVQLEKETHLRIIWSCSWSGDSKLFVTGSRDKTIKIWERTNKFRVTHKKEFSSAVTAVNFLPMQDDFIVVGLESGDIYILKYHRESSNDEVVFRVPDFLAHGASVKRIKSVASGNTIKVATCSEDFSVRIFEIEVDKLTASKTNK